MLKINNAIILMLCIFLSECTSKKPEPNNFEVKKDTIHKPDEDSLHIVKTPDANPVSDKWSEITKEISGVFIDIRYATVNNFTKKQIYDCGKCFLRPEAARALIDIQLELKQKHELGLKVFDCFRPKVYQQKLWDIVPNPDYVTPPTKGSMHSRGLAVDLTIVDKNGKELDMGTGYDYFGEEAHQDYKELPPAVLKNRLLLKNTMEAHGFSSIRTEWWHYSYAASYPLDKWVWSCN